MTYPATQTYWLEPTDRVRVGLRRYTRNSLGFTCVGGYHSALVIIGEEPAEFEESDGRRYLAAHESVVPVSEREDPRWPKTCEKCDYIFTDRDVWQHWQELLYRRTDTGEETTLRDAPPGASWDAWWLPDNYRGLDGIALMVRCPDGHDWTVDSEASNCTRKGEPHQCWVRHGDPREYRVTVDKNGDTCAAGAGSIATPEYHGFLRDGVLTAG